MNLLFFIQSLGSGGAERVVVNLSNYWVRKGWTITIVTLAPQTIDFYKLDPFVRRIALDSAGFSGNPFLALYNNIKRIRGLRRILHTLKPDIALSMMTTANILLAIANFGSKNIVTIGSERTHPPYAYIGKIWRYLRKYWYNKLTRVVALTSESQKWLLENTKAKNVVVIPNFISWPIQKQEPIILPQEICKKQHKIILAVGRLSEEKGFDLLIKIFSSLAQKYLNWDLIILGEGKQRFILESLIEQFNMSDRIILPGSVGNISDWYTYADIYVMTSLFEGFPNTLVEAMSYHLPVLSFDCDTGPRDIIKHQVSGLLIIPGDLKAFQEALSYLISNEDIRKQLADCALEVKKQFSVEKIITMWEDLFNQLLGDKYIQDKSR